MSTPQPAQPHSSADETLRAVLERHVEYRSDKRWKIFSWASSLNVGTLVASAFLEDLSRGGRFLIGGAILAVSAYALAWLIADRRAWRVAKDRLDQVDRELGIREHVAGLGKRPAWAPTYEITVVFLAVLAWLMLMVR